MIYLIGGSPRCGKTILAKRISSKQNISWITTDAIRPIVLNSIPKSEIKAKFPQEFMQAPRNEFRFDVYEPQALLKAQLIEAKTMWPGVKALIIQLRNCKQDYIIEGIHLLPKFINEFKNTKYWKNLKVIYLIKKDVESIKVGFLKNKKEFDWMLPKTKNDPYRLTKVAEMVKVKSEYFEKEAKKYNFILYNTDTNFNNKLADAQKCFFK